MFVNLHAVKAQYHEDCFKKFTSKRNISASAHPVVKEEISPADFAINLVIKKLKENPSRIWNSIELYTLYREHLESLTSTSLTEALATVDRKERAWLMHKL